MSGGIYDHGRGSINDITSCYLFVSSLKKIFLGHRSSNWCYTSVNRKDSTHRNIYVDIRRSVQRIYKHYVFVLVVWITVFNGDKIIFFFAGNSANNLAIGQGFYKGLVSKHVKFLLILSLNVHISCGAQNIYKTCFVNLVIDHFSCQSYGIDESGKFTGRVFEFTLIFNDEFAQCLVSDSHVGS